MPEGVVFGQQMLLVVVLLLVVMLLLVQLLLVQLLLLMVALVAVPMLLPIVAAQLPAVAPQPGRDDFDRFGACFAQRLLEEWENLSCVA